MKVTPHVVRFDWSTQGYELIRLAKGDIVRDIAVSVDNAFNGPGAWMRVQSLIGPPVILVDYWEVQLCVYGDYRHPLTYECADPDGQSFDLELMAEGSDRGHGTIMFTTIRGA